MRADAHKDTTSTGGTPDTETQSRTAEKSARPALDFSSGLCTKSGNEQEILEQMQSAYDLWQKEQAARAERSKEQAKEWYEKRKAKRRAWQKKWRENRILFLEEVSHGYLGRKSI